eukprot:scaffold14196_cov131-Skeletonema_dohrnii-CCMP3373.AAC.2
MGGSALLLFYRTLLGKTGSDAALRRRRGAAPCHQPNKTERSCLYSEKLHAGLKVEVWSYTFKFIATLV